MTNKAITTYNFSAGVLSPELTSDINLAKQGLGVLQAENMMVTSSGTLEKKPGTENIADAKGVAMLENFVFNSTQGYALEFGNLYIRFFRDGAQLVSGSTPVEVVTPYTSDELEELSYIQDADVLYIAHRNHDTKKLTRVTDTSWTLTDLLFQPDVEDTTNFALSKATAPSPTVQFEWAYAITTVNKAGQEGQISSEAVITADIELSTQPVTISFDAPADVTDVSSYRIYRKKGIYFYLISIITEDGSTSYSKKDVGLEGDGTVTPPEAFTDFDGTGNKPDVIGMYNQRLILGATDNKPNTLWFSRIGQFDNFTSTPLKLTDEGASVKLNSNEVNRITHLSRKEDLIALTEGDIWRIKGEPNIDLIAYVESTVGVGIINPVKTRKSLLFLEGNENTISDFIYSDTVSGYDGDDLGVYARVLFDGYTIVDFAFSSFPEPRLFAIRDDGKMLCLTYLKSQNIMGWTILSTNGLYESVTVVRKTGYDEIYLIVNRDGVRSVELMKRKLLANEEISEAWYVDNGIRYDGTKTSAITITAGAVVSDADDFVATNVGDNIIIGENKYEILTYVDSKNVTVASAVTGVSTSDWILTASQLSGLDYLDGYDGEIYALCDADGLRGLTVTDGAISFDSTYSKITIGLGYESFIETISNNEVAASVGSTNGRTKRITKAFIGVLRSRGISWKTLQNGHWQRLPENSSLELNADIALQTAKIPLDLLSGNHLDDTVYIKSDYPLPLNILNVTISMSFEGEK